MSNSSCKNKDLCQIGHEGLHMTFRIDNECSDMLIVKNVQKHVVINNGVIIEFVTKRKFYMLNVYYLK